MYNNALLTCHGTFLYFDCEKHTFVHRKYGEQKIVERIVTTELEVCYSGAMYRTIVKLRVFSDSNAFNNVGEFTVIASGDGRLVSLQSMKENFFRAQPEGSVGFNSKKALGWEFFIILSESEIGDILDVRDCSWISKDKRQILRGAEIDWVPNFHLLVGQERIDLRFGNPFIGREYSEQISERDHRNTDASRLVSFVLVKDGWKILANFVRFDPLIWYAVFGSDFLFRQLRISLVSLSSAGRYHGKVLILTDRPENSVAEFIPAQIRNQCQIQFLAVKPFYGDYCFARYAILESKLAVSCAPLLYCDTDIVFDTAVEPILLDIALRDKIAAQREPDAIGSCGSLGSVLFLEAGWDIGRTGGFNAGCLGIPSFAKGKKVIDLVRELARAYKLAKGEIELTGDQQFLNFVAFALDCVDGEPLTQAIRVGVPDIDPDPSKRTGLVHFWPSRGAEEKFFAMKLYVDKLNLTKPPAAE